MPLGVRIEVDRIREQDGTDTYRLTLSTPLGQRATFIDLTRIDLRVLSAHINEALD